MEAVHETYRTSWVSDLISVKEFRDAAFLTNRLKFNIKDEIHCSVEERMMLAFGDRDFLEKQEKSCSPDLLNAEGDSDLDIEYCSEFVPPKNNKLMTLKFQAQHMNFRNEEEIKWSYRRRVFLNRRYKHYHNSMEVFSRKWESNSNESKKVLVEHPEVVLTVQIYRPRREQKEELYDKYYIDRNMLHVDQEFEVLGSQYLTEVRDGIHCLSDLANVGNEDPLSGSAKPCKDVYKSGFFYINGTFYNDMRDPQNKEYSKPIIEWSKTARGVGPFSVAKMEEARFVDLEIQLGLPYLYMHQGHCEHVLVFSDLRLMSSRDHQILSDYPISQVLHRKGLLRCMVCFLFRAKWVTTEDSRLLELPFFFCQKCFIGFNYDAEGNRIADFKAHRYVDRNSVC